MLYLKDNYFLERELSKDDIKDRILGHWGTVPGLNFIYAGLAYAAKKYNRRCY
jgi:xylulose-5-phosphate/fructose-6-phosphate phosphoketolase